MAKSKKKKGKQPTNSDRLVQYIQDRAHQNDTVRWSLDDLARELYVNFDDVSGSVRETFRASTMNAYGTARSKLLDLHEQLVIPVERLGNRVVKWKLATNAVEDQAFIQKVSENRQARAQGFAASYEKLQALIAKRGWLVHKPNNKPKVQ